MGSVYKRGNHYCIRIDLPPGPDGRRRQRRISCKGMTKRQAEAELARITAEINGRTYIEPSRLTVSEYMARWRRDCAVHQQSPNTLESTDSYIANHIEPGLGWIRLSHLSPLHIQEFVNALARDGRYDGAPLAPKTVRNIHGVLYQALKQAVIWELIRSNPAEGTALPRSRRPNKRAATSAEVAIILTRIERSRYRLPILTALMTGMRRSEILGLRWEDVFDVVIEGKHYQALRVHRAIAYTTALGAYVKVTKTIAGDRGVLIPHTLAAELREHRKRQIERSSDEADPYRDNGWIFCTDAGELVKPPLLGKEFARLARSVGVDLTIHAFRHTNATVQYEQGVQGLTISRRLGHSGVGITENIYTHIDVRMQRAAVQAMDQFYDEALELVRRKEADR